MLALIKKGTGMVVGRPRRKRKKHRYLFTKKRRLAFKGKPPAGYFHIEEISFCMEQAAQSGPIKKKLRKKSGQHLCPRGRGGEGPTRLASSCGIKFCPPRAR